jgi:hypothetical protein
VRTVTAEKPVQASWEAVRGAAVAEEGLAEALQAWLAACRAGAWDSR